MDHHIRNTEKINLNRRQVLAGGSACVLGGAALAGTSAAHAAEPSPEAQLDACISQLNSILAHMHPRVARQPAATVRSREDGSYRLHLYGDVDFVEFSGSGLYEISFDGSLMFYWLEKKQKRSRLTGLPIPGLEYFEATLWVDGEFIETREMYEPRLIRKLDWRPE